MEPSPATVLERIDLDGVTTSDAFFLTANNRQARALRSRLELRRGGAGTQVWESPQVMPWSSWLSLAYRELIDLGHARDLPLSAVQERLIWEDIIAHSPSGRDLMRREAAAKTAVGAYRLLREWCLPREQVEAYAGAETEAFLAWVDAFERRCATRRWVAAAALTERITAAVDDGRLAAPQRLVLAGFDEYSPAQRRLLAALQSAEHRVETLADGENPTLPQRVRAADAREEIASAARWAREWLSTRPAARIGIAVPDLANRRRAIVDGLTRVLQPEVFAPDPEAAPAWFEFSLGLPLAEFPPVHDALLALGLGLGELPLSDLSRLLRSPFLDGGASEWAARGALDARLHEHRRPTLNLARLLKIAQQTAPGAAHDCPRWSAILARARAVARAAPGRASPSRWAVHFAELLVALGWPGDRALDSAEYQTVQRFRELLAEFAATDRYTGTYSLPEARALLRTLANETLFQPEGSGAPIQVLGMLEAGGLQFDAVWIMGLDDEHWPPPATPNPLLPASLQRQYDLPHASSEREQVFARRLLDRLLASAPEAFVSHPCRDGDRELRASPLIAAYPTGAAPASAAPDPWEAAPSVALEQVADARAPAPGTALRGGTQIIAAQAVCPFSAVAGHRLNAHALEAPCHVPDGRIVGQLIHRALEQLWRAIGDSARLLDMADTERSEAAGIAVDAALGEVVRQRPDLFGANLQRLEHERLVGLLLGWLQLEEARAPFAVERLEARESMALGGLSLHLRGDRVDRLADGRLVVIDYKTGRDAAPGDWTGERPTEPQLPLYSIACAEPVGAAVIARVRSGRLAWLGVAQDTALFPGVPAFEGDAPDIADWPALLQHWRERLEALAAEIRAGRATATPSPAACAYCPYPTLCRVHEATESGRGGTGDAAA